MEMIGFELISISVVASDAQIFGLRIGGTVKMKKINKARDM